MSRRDRFRTVRRAGLWPMIGSGLSIALALLMTVGWSALRSQPDTPAAVPTATTANAPMMDWNPSPSADLTMVEASGKARMVFTNVRSLAPR